MGNQKIIIAAGGTGGHIVPALAVGAALKKVSPGAEILFVGTGKEIEKKLIEGAGFPLANLSASPARGGGAVKKAKLFLSAPGYLFNAIRFLRREKAAVVVGFGGYPVFFPMLAARVLGLPTLLQEQNVQAGLANRILSLFVRRIFAVPGAHGFYRSAQVTAMPNPVRQEFLQLMPYAPPRGRVRILVLGGSQGARRVNDAMLKLVPLFREIGAELVHQAGKNDFERVSSAYAAAGFQPLRVVDFTKDVAKELDEAHLIICRAGAMTVAEVSAAGRPAIYVPLQIAGAHQWENVKRHVDEGAALSVTQDEMLEPNLERTLRELMSNPARLTAMAAAAKRLAAFEGKDPAAEIAREVVGLLGRGAASA